MTKIEPSSREKAHLTYSSYLRLPLILAAQDPVSGEHDEMLFIIIHQASELWMKLCLHELAAAREKIREDHLGPAFKMIARVGRIQAQLIQSWDVLATMTPFDYSAIRPHLGSSSGFQSSQYRLIEFLMGNKNRAMLELHRDDEAVHRTLEAMLNEPSLYDESLRLLKKRGFAIPLDRYERDWSRPYEPDARVDAQYNRELQLELSIANQISPKDPMSAFRMAEDTLKQGVSRDLVNTLQQLRTKDPGLATRLSNDIASRLANESFLQHPEAANLATSFLQINRTASLIPEPEYRNLFQKVVNEALSYTMSFPNSYSMERNAAQNLLNSVKSMSRELQAYAPDQREAVEKKL